MRLLKMQMRQFIGHMPPGTSPAQRGALLSLFAFDDSDDGAVLSHADLGTLGGYSASTSHRATKALERDGHIASAPRFREGEDQSQAANSYAVLAFDAFERELVVSIDAPAPPLKMLRGLSSVSNQQKEIPEKTVVREAAPVDNPPPVDNPSSELDPTPADRAALAVVGRALKFPQPETVPTPEPGSALDAVRKRWDWSGYGQVWQLLQSREGQSLAHVVAPALAALLRRPPDKVDNPAGYVRTTMRTMAKAGPGLYATRPAPDTPAPGSLAELQLRFATLRGLRDSSVGDPERYGQLSQAVYKLGREISACHVAQKTRTA